MAQRRMIDKKISVSEQVANMPIEAQLLFTWMIPHADDLGLLPYSNRTIKALVVPMLDITVEDIGNHLETMKSQNLITIFKWEGKQFWKIISFLNNQTLKKDRKPNTIASNITDWKQVENIGFQVEDIGNPSKVKISKEKLSKDDDEEILIPTKKTNPLQLGKGQMMSYLKEFPGLTSTELKEEISKCNTYMGMSSVDYGNPGLFLRKWIKRFMEEKAKKRANAEQLKKEDELNESISWEQRKKNIEKITEIKRELIQRTTL